MDSLLQIKILQEDSRGLFVPTYIQKFTIDAKRHAADVQEVDTKSKDVGELNGLNLNDTVQLNNGELQACYTFLLRTIWYLVSALSFSLGVCNTFPNRV
jgi:hypothetical protein